MRMQQPIYGDHPLRLSRFTAGVVISIAVAFCTVIAGCRSTPATTQPTATLAAQTVAHVQAADAQVVTAAKAVESIDAGRPETVIAGKATATPALQAAHAELQQATDTGKQTVQGAKADAAKIEKQAATIVELKKSNPLKDVLWWLAVVCVPLGIAGLILSAFASRLPFLPGWTATAAIIVLAFGGACYLLAQYFVWFTLAAWIAGGLLAVYVLCANKGVANLLWAIVKTPEEGVIGLWHRVKAMLTGKTGTDSVLPTNTPKPPTP